MRKNRKLIICIVLAAMICAMLPTNKTEAAYIAWLGTSLDECKDSYSIKINEKIDLNYYNVRYYQNKTDAATVRWNSSDPTVATVDGSGIVTGKKDGKVTITFECSTAINGKSYKGSCEVVVGNGETAPSPTPTKATTVTITTTPTKKVTPTPTKKVTPTPTKKVTVTPTKTATPTTKVTTAPTPTTKPSNLVEGTANAELYSYNQIAIFYPNASEAAAAIKEGIQVKRARKFSSTTKYTNFTAKASISPEDDTVVFLEGYFARDAEYCVWARGLDKNGDTVVITLGSPYRVELVYLPAELSATGGVDITGTRSLTNGEAKPVVYVYDEAGTIVGIRSGNANQGTDEVLSGTFRFTKATNAVTGAALMSETTGIIRFSSLKQYMDMICTWSSKDGKIKRESSSVHVAPIEYVLPDLGGYVSNMTLTTERGDKIVWPEESDSDSYYGTISAKATAMLTYYFTGSDDKKYSGSPIAYSSANIEQLNAAKYRYMYKAAEGSEQYALVTSDGRVTGLKEGVQTIYLWQLEQGRSYITDDAEIVGEINVEVRASSYCATITFDNYYQIGYTNAATRQLIIEFKLWDQYADEFTAYSGYFRTTEGRVEFDEGNHSGRIIIDYPASAVNVREVKVFYSTTAEASFYYTIESR